MSAAGLVSATPPAPAPPGAPAPAMPPGPEYYEEEELESAEEEDGERSARARDSDEDTEDASETDLAKHEEEDFVEMKEQMYQDKLASLKRQLQQLQEGTLQEYQKRMKKLDQQYKERIRNAELFLQLETDQVEKNYVKEKKAAAKEFEDKKIELKENLIAELEEKKKMIENEKLTMELTGDSMEVKPIMTRKLRRRPNDPVPIPDKRRKPAPDILQNHWRAFVFEVSMLPARQSTSVLLHTGNKKELADCSLQQSKLKNTENAPCLVPPSSKCQCAKGCSWMLLSENLVAYV
ncbi:sin3 histone deacetylase corepressor complex component SDS3 isoform X3 [Lagopus leucura]|uniref:sin3 histone deacetylase corepressor complex component SDS3 isoform X3 n=1 Tax=Lagopus leucura TaxID=30410 RepID=UPI001C668DD6|nr:sin3 histone deacetylase corepressor complex component SDS3 isoform X3 [Lagopus leucura]